MKVVLKMESSARNATWFVADEAFAVLAIMNQSDCSKLLLWSEKQQAVGLFPASDFNVIDARLPAQWEASVYASGHIELSPKEWKATGFWEAYHDADPSAERLFRSVAQALMAAS